MQLATDAALADAVDAAERKLRWRVLVDWNRDGLFNHPLSDVSTFIGDLEIDRDLASDIPEEVGLLQGIASAELRMTWVGSVRTTAAGGVDLIPPDGQLDVDGQDLSVAKVLSPYRTDSPLYQVTKLGCVVRVELGMMTASGERMIRQFTGKIRDITVDREKGTAAVHALDYSEAFRKPLTLGFGAMGLKEHVCYPRERYPFYLNSQVVIDQIARANGFYATPPHHPGSIYALTCHGGFTAEVGECRTPTGTVGLYPGSYWQPGPGGMLSPTGTWAQYATVPGLADDHYHCWSGSGIAVNAYLYWPGSVTGGSSSVDIITVAMGKTVTGVITVDNDGYVRARFKRGATIKEAPGFYLQTGWNAVGGYWQFKPATGFIGTLQIHTICNGVDAVNVYTPAQYGSLPAIGNDDWHRTTRVDYRTALAMTDLSVYVLSPGRDLTSSDWLPAATAFTPTAAIGVGLNELAYVPDVVNQDSWTLLQQVVGAEAGLCGFTEAGTFFFQNRAEANTDTTVWKTIRAQRALKGLAVETSSDAVRNVVTVTTQDGYVGSLSTIWQPDDPVQLDSPPGNTLFDVTLEPNTLTKLDTEIKRVAAADWSGAGDDELVEGFVVIRQDDNLTEVTSNVKAWFAETGPRVGELLISNGNSYWVRFATPVPQPPEGEPAPTGEDAESKTAAFKIPGYALVEEPEQINTYRHETSVALHGERTMEIAKTVWLQSELAGQVIAESILAYTNTPRPLMRNVPVVGDPRLQLGDRVELSDPLGLGVIPGHVVSIARRLTQAGLEDTLSVRAV